MKMEIVKENEEAVSGNSSLQEERKRMQMNVQSAASSMSARGPPARSSSLMRNAVAPVRSSRGLPARANSMRAIRPLAPTKGTDAMASMRSVQRANSSRLLQRANSTRGPPRRGPPIRTSSEASTNSLRAYQREQLANQSISSKINPGGMDRLRGPGGTLERHESDMSNFTNGDLSCFTMDSVNLRKTQLVADPILDDEDDMAYNETDSYADHESVSRASQFSEYPIEASQLQRYPSRGVKKSLSCDSIGPMRFDKLQITNKTRAAAAAAAAAAHDDHDSDEDSFGTMTSGLTTDFTEHEFLEDSESEEGQTNDHEEDEDDDNDGNVLMEEDEDDD